MGGKRATAQLSFGMAARQGNKPSTEERANRLIAGVRHIFSQLAEKHRLALEWDDAAPVELAAHLRKQPGLDWSLWLNLQNGDEIGVQNEFFYVEWFPADKAEREAEFIRVVDGLISGSVRLVCKFNRFGKLPYSVAFETENENGWVQVTGYARGFHIGRPAGTMILRNGHETLREGRAINMSPPE